MKKFIDESWLVLTMGIAFAALLAGAQTTWQGKIRENQAKALNLAVAEVVPAMDAEQERETLDIDGNTVFKCRAADGSLAGWAVQASGGGFIDKINVVVGISPDGSEIIGVKVVSHLETPGLGNKIERVEGNPFPYQFDGKSTATPFALTKQTPATDSEIQAITGATYSSQYTMDIVNDVLTRIVPQLPKE